MVVALGTFQAQSEPDHAGCFDSVNGVLDAKFFGNRPTFVGGCIVPVESGRNFLLDRGVWYQIPSKLFNGEFVERFVRVVRVDRPVTPRPHIARAIGVKDARISIPGGIHPHQSHPFAEVLRSKQPVDGFLISNMGIDVGFGEELIDFGDGRRQPGQIKGNPSQDSLQVSGLVR